MDEYASLSLKVLNNQYMSFNKSESGFEFYPTVLYHFATAVIFIPKFRLISQNCNLKQI